MRTCDEHLKIALLLYEARSHEAEPYADGFIRGWREALEWLLEEHEHPSPENQDEEIICMIIEELDE